MEYQIKFNGVTDLIDARFAASVMAQWIGFTVGQINDLTIPQIQEIIQWCHGPKLLLQLQPNTTAQEVLTYCNALPVRAIECTATLMETLQNQVQNIEFIANSDATTPNNSLIKSTLFLPIDSLNASEVLNSGAQFLSLTCLPQSTQQVGEKDINPWYDFFEELGIL